MAATNNLGITLVEQAQAQKEVTVNQAFTRIDAVLNTGAISIGDNTPPGSPSDGDLYIVGSSPTDAWSGHAGEIAYYDQLWKFIVPKEGMMLWVNDEDVTYVFDGASWNSAIGGDVGAIEALSSTGFAVRTGSDTWVTRTLTAGAGMSVSNGSGVGGNPIITCTAGFSNLSDAGIISPVNGENLQYAGGLWRNKKGLPTVFYNVQSGTSYTLQSTDAGQTMYFTNSSVITLTLPNNMSVGSVFDIIQAGTGQVTFSAASGATRLHRLSHSKTAGQMAVAKIQVVTNSSGSSAVYVLSGDTAA